MTFIVFTFLNDQIHTMKRLVVKHVDRLLLVGEIVCVHYRAYEVTRKIDAIFFFSHSFSLTLTHSHEQSSRRRPCKKKRSSISTAKCKQIIDVSDKE